MLRGHVQDGGPRRSVADEPGGDRSRDQGSPQRSQTSFPARPTARPAGSSRR